MKSRNQTNLGLGSCFKEEKHEGKVQEATDQELSLSILRNLKAKHIAAGVVGKGDDLNEKLGILAELIYTIGACDSSGYHQRHSVKKMKKLVDQLNELTK